ncbi:hypothetical protein DV735_g5637, partial [Chaetothyriales sp. CBS 134920]
MNEAAALQIMRLGQKGQKYHLEDVVSHVWGEIPRTYFPNRATTKSGIRYAVERESYRGVASHRQGIRPDVVIIKLHTTIRQGRQQQREPKLAERDIAFIKCKAASEDVPNGWHSAIREAVKRLETAHAMRKIYLIIAIGLRWLPFLWDPTTPLDSPLKVLKKNQRDGWLVDRRLRPIEARRGQLPGQRHIANINGMLVVDTTLAYSLNFWEIAGNGQLLHEKDLVLLESFLCLIKTTKYVGWNS